MSDRPVLPPLWGCLGLLVRLPLIIGVLVLTAIVVVFLLDALGMLAVHAVLWLKRSVL